MFTNYPYIETYTDDFTVPMSIFGMRSAAFEKIFRFFENRFRFFDTV